MSHDVFISYSSKDADAGFAVCAALEGHGVRCWMAPRDIVPGEGWAKSILGAIGRSRAMVLLLTESANHSQQVEREVERAVNKRIPIIPLRIENVMPGEALEYFLSAPHWLDAFTPPLDQHLDRLAEAVQTLLETKFAKKSADELGQLVSVQRPEDPPPEVEQADPSLMADLTEMADTPDVTQLHEKPNTTLDPDTALDSGGTKDNAPAAPPNEERASEERGAELSAALAAADLDTARKLARRRSLVLIAALTSVAAVVTITAAAVWIGLFLFPGPVPPV